MKFAWFTLIICISSSISAVTGALASDYDEDHPLSYQFNESRILNSSKVIESRISNTSGVIEGAGSTYWSYLGGQPIGIAYGVMYGVCHAATYQLFEYVGPWEVEYSEKVLTDLTFFSSVVVAPIMEEVLRGTFYLTIKDLVLHKVTNKDAEDLVTPAAIISGTVFASLHFHQYQKSVLIMLVLRSFISSFHGFLFEAQGYTSAVVAHATYNFIAWLSITLQRKYPPLP